MELKFSEHCDDVHNPACWVTAPSSRCLLYLLCVECFPFFSSEAQIKDGSLYAGDEFETVNFSKEENYLRQIHFIHDNQHSSKNSKMADGVNTAMSFLQRHFYCNILANLGEEKSILSGDTKIDSYEDTSSFSAFTFQAKGLYQNKLEKKNKKTITLFFCLKMTCMRYSFQITILFFGQNMTRFHCSNNMF